MSRSNWIMLLFVAVIVAPAIYVWSKNCDGTEVIISGDEFKKEIEDSLRNENKKKDSIILAYQDSLASSRKRDDKLKKNEDKIKVFYDKKYSDITIATLRGKDSILRASVPGL